MSCGGYGGLYGLYGLFDSSARDAGWVSVVVLGGWGWMRGVVGEGEDGLGDLCVGGRGLGVLCVDRTRGRGPGLFERSGWEAGFEVGCGICVGLLVLSLGIPKLAGSLRILHVSGYNVIETPRCCGMLSVTIA